VLITDDQPVDCARVAVTYGILHDEHGHGLSTAQGCSGSFVTLFDAGHAGAEGLAAGFLAEYLDAPTEPGVPALFAQALLRLEQAPAP
jgi:hypothetical protein